MSLSAGTRLGPYEILTPLGAGGMGEVCRARDPRMGREVAIKVSAQRFSDRFEREVRAVAALTAGPSCRWRSSRAPTGFTARFTSFCATMEWTPRTIF